MYREKYEIFRDTGLRIETLHPVLTTSLPKSYNKLEEKILKWCDIKNNLYNGQAGLQFSINSTNEKQRGVMYNDMQLSLDELSKIADKMTDPIGRKYCLNFAYSSDFIIDGGYLKNRFDPDKFMCKITPIHNNNACIENNIQTIDGYNSYTPYKTPEINLKDAGYDVLVFIPSIDEEDGLVTCGNAILGGSTLKVKDSKLSIEGIQK